MLTFIVKTLPPSFPGMKKLNRPWNIYKLFMMLLFMFNKWWEKHPVGCYINNKKLTIDCSVSLVDRFKLFLLNQVQKENCGKVPKDTTEQRERKECLPFELTAAQLEDMHRYDPCAQYQVKKNKMF